MDYVELYQDTAGEWRWRRTAPNGEIVATSGEGYARRIDCKAEAIKVNGSTVAYESEEGSGG